jgi:hypothetical protein
MKPIKLDPNHESHWTTHAKQEGWGDNFGNDIPEGWELDPVWGPINGAVRPKAENPIWNEWAAENPQPEAKALAQFDPSDSLMRAIKGITTGVRPVEN